MVRIPSWEQYATRTETVSTVIPLRELALKLRNGDPLYFRCPCNVFPAWSKKHAVSWKASEGGIPGNGAATTTAEYVVRFDEMNNLVSVDSLPLRMAA
jgi:hypothetical protein